MKRALDILTKTYNKNRLSHLYIFSGITGTGKKELALELSKVILKPYDKSSNFEQNIDSLNHPQVHYIEPEGLSIKKSQILDLQTEFSKTSLIYGPRIYIIQDIDLISNSAANSLLKFMEEPESSFVYGLLLTTNISNVLPTIISRAQNIKLIAINQEQFVNNLLDSGIDERLASNIAVVTNSIEYANELKDDEIFLSIIDFIEEIIENWRNKDYSISLKVYNDLSFIAYDRKNYQIFLELMLVYLLDIIHYKTHQTIAFKYFKESIQKMSNSVEITTLERLTSAIQDEIEKQTYYINISLSLDALVLLIESSR